MTESVRMAGQLMVIDDDLAIVDDFKRQICACRPCVHVLGTPEVTIEIRDICRHLPAVSALILDLNLGGSADRGLWILSKLAADLLKYNVAVVLWSKYVMRTSMLAGGTLYTLVGGMVSTLQATRTDQALITKTRERYSGVRGLVSKLVEDPASELVTALEFLTLL